ncbi:HAMP domain-containing histidine kinase [Geobacillus stearothermophilus]|nr:HAMP domain-containing histidine kinase [Geobacillus stearothermophilus]
MFHKTLWRLTFVNSLVVFFVISALGVVLYVYMQERLYHAADVPLERLAERIRQGGPWRKNDALLGDPLFHDPLLRDPRLLVVIWNEKGEMVGMTRDASFFTGLPLTPPERLDELYEVNVGHLYFRTLAVEVNTAFGPITVQMLRNTNSERELLGELMFMIAVGCMLSALFAIAAGYFLAGRALVPIQAAWKKQQQFVSDASHELRTPLSVIQAKTDALFRSPKATIEEKSVDISVIAKECRRLSRLVSQLLTLARSDSNQLEMQKEAFRLDELVRDIGEQYSEIASYQQKTMSVEAQIPIEWVGDRERIHQLIVILLDNALKYTTEGGHIRLACHRFSSSVVVEVEDDGIGIPTEDLPRIFDRFYQSDKARSQSDGAGLGLAIAKWIIDQHHGKVKVESKLGEGTRFQVMFPAARWKYKRPGD